MIVGEFLQLSLIGCPFGDIAVHRLVETLISKWEILLAL